MNGNIPQLNSNTSFHQRVLAYTTNHPGVGYAEAASHLAAQDARQTLPAPKPC